MKKYIIEVSEACMNDMQALKRDRKFRSISKVIEYLVERYPEMERLREADEKEIFHLNKKIIDLAMKL